MYKLFINGRAPTYFVHTLLSRRPPDIILCRSFTRPSTVLGDKRPGNEASENPLTVFVSCDKHSFINGSVHGLYTVDGDLLKEVARELDDGAGAVRLLDRQLHQLDSFCLRCISPAGTLEREE